MLLVKLVCVCAHAHTRTRAHTLLCMCTTRRECPQNPEEGICSLGSEVTDSCALWCRFWELNTGLCKSSKCSSPLRQLICSPGFGFLKAFFLQRVQIQPPARHLPNPPSPTKKTGKKDFGFRECNLSPGATDCLCEVKQIFPWNFNTGSCKIVTNNIYTAGLFPLLRNMSTNFLGQYKQ